MYRRDFLNAARVLPLGALLPPRLVAAQRSAGMRAPRGLGGVWRGLVYMDRFEEESNWKTDEEIVGGSPCYAENIGEAIRSTDYPLDGHYSLRVWANKAGSIRSNHVIAGKTVFESGRNGTWLCRVRAFIAPETASTGQVGPEFSVQNTREIASGVKTTSTAGIQYQANPFLPRKWFVWVEVALGVADWVDFMELPIEAGKWYTISVEADYNNNRYGWFLLEGEDVDVAMDLSQYKIAHELKGFDPAFVITVEAENLWNNCGTAGVTEYKMYYDHVQLIGRP